MRKGCQKCFELLQNQTDQKYRKPAYAETYLQWKFAGSNPLHKACSSSRYLLRCIADFASHNVAFRSTAYGAYGKRTLSFSAVESQPRCICSIQAGRCTVASTSYGTAAGFIEPTRWSFHLMTLTTNSRLGAGGTGGSAANASLCTPISWARLALCA